MRRSKLEIHIDILRLLAQRGPMKVTHIMYKINVCHKYLERYLSLLIKQGLVETRTLSDRKVVFVITEKGKAVLKTFRQLTMTISEGGRPYEISSMILAS